MPDQDWSPLLNEMRSGLEALEGVCTHRVTLLRRARPDGGERLVLCGHYKASHVRRTEINTDTGQGMEIERCLECEPITPSGGAHQWTP